MLAVLDIALLLAAVAWDFTSLVLNVRRAVKGSGASGVPVISWLVYVALLEWREANFHLRPGRSSWRCVNDLPRSLSLWHPLDCWVVRKEKIQRLKE